MLPDEERSLMSKGQFEAMLAVMMGGQVAEEVVFGEVTTGASDDLQNATGVARKMVTEYGMSDELGPQTFESGGGQVFLGREMSSGRKYSDVVAQKIDAETNVLLRKAKETAKWAIERNSLILHKLADKLIDSETVHGPELLELFAEDAASEVSIHPPDVLGAEFPIDVVPELRQQVPAPQSGDHTI